VTVSLCSYWSDPCFRRSRFGLCWLLGLLTTQTSTTSFRCLITVSSNVCRTCVLRSCV